MTLQEAVAARRSIRSFEDRAVPQEIVMRAIETAVQAPAPHHSSPWRFVLLTSAEDKTSFSSAMGARWRDDLSKDGLGSQEATSIVDRSHRLLTSTPLLTVCCADMSRAHEYPDEDRRLAEWSLFAHSVGAALQGYMLALAEEGVGSCWISAPVFCRDVVKDHLELPEHVEPHALVLVGYPDPSYETRPRPRPEAGSYLLR